MRNLALGVLNYESAHRHLPPPTESRGPERQTGLSWRIHILPFLGEADLFNQFAIDEPWDSETNIKLLPKMPAIYSDYYGLKFTNGKTTVAFCDASDQSLVENNDWLGLFEMNDGKIVQPR